MAYFMSPFKHPITRQLAKLSGFLQQPRALSDSPEQPREQSDSLVRPRVLNDSPVRPREQSDFLKLLDELNDSLVLLRAPSDSPELLRVRNDSLKQPRVRNDSLVQPREQSEFLVQRHALTVLGGHYEQTINQVLSEQSEFLVQRHALNDFLKQLHEQTKFDELHAQIEFQWLNDGCLELWTCLSGRAVHFLIDPIVATFH